MANQIVMSEKLFLQSETKAKLKELLPFYKQGLMANQIAMSEKFFPQSETKAATESEIISAIL